MSYTERCQGVTSAGKQCKCWATQKINEIPYCDQHAEKEMRATAAKQPALRGE